LVLVCRNQSDYCLTNRQDWRYNPQRMSEEATTIPKKTTRSRKTSSSSAASTLALATPPSKALRVLEELFTDLIKSISEAKEEFVGLQKEIEETKLSWEKEQRMHQQQLAERDQQEELERRREKEAYEYETHRARKQMEDEFSEKRVKWEKELASKKEEIEKERHELISLRKLADGFEEEKSKAVKEACSQLQKELTGEFSTKEKMREQEFKAEKEILVLRITNLTSENARQTQEIESLKKSLEEATSQLKDVAVKVIESSSRQQVPQE